MRNLNFHMLLFVSLSLFSFLGCSKNDDNAAPAEQLPPATQIGANTAGAYINGELLVPKNSLPDFGSPAAQGLKFVVGPHFFNPNGNDYFALVVANRKDLGGDYLYLQLPSLLNGMDDYQIDESNGQFWIDGPNHPHVIVFTLDDEGNQKTYYSGSNSGEISITRFDVANGIFSGEFSATVYNIVDPSDIIQVTDGRFDVCGNTLNQ